MLAIKFLFWPLKPVKILGFSFQGIIPSKQQTAAENIGRLVEAEFNAYKGFDEKIADPALLQKLRPDIEGHVDHFLKEKLKTVFPLISQFMGEKTLSQFKSAFMEEMDHLFPILMHNYASSIKEQLKPGPIVSEKIMALSIDQLRRSFFHHAAPGLRRFKIACAFLGALGGGITACILHFTQI